MKSRLIPILLACASAASLARADFNPITLTPGSFTGDVIVESNATKTLNDYVTATMDGGTNNNGSTFYETGYASPWPWTGVPVAGSTFNSVADPAGHQFKMPPSYTTNNAVMISTNAGFTTGKLTVTAPVPLSSISLLATAGNGPASVDYTIQYDDGSTQPGNVSVLDWTVGTSYAWIAHGRLNLDDGTIASLDYTNGLNRRLLYFDIGLSDAVHAVTNIQFSYVSGGRAAIFGLSGSTGAAFTPLDVTGFDRDMIVEATAPNTGFSKGASVSLDSDVANTGNGFYEQGFNTGALATGVPTNGTSFTAGTRTFTMPSDYTTSNAFFLSADVKYTSATISLTTPASYTGLTFLASAGNGPCVISVTVHHSADPDEVFSISVLDWFNGAAADWLANGRYQKENIAFNNVNGGAVKLFHNDITLAGTSTVTGIDLTRTSGGRAAIFAVSGSTGGDFNPIAISGYNADAIVERALKSPPNPLTTATTITMDGGTNNTANTWYEVGYYKGQPQSGFPAANSTIDSLAQPDHHYKMPASYSANDTIFVDNAHTTANMAIASPQTYSAISFLSATANGTVTNQAIMQYADGTSETNTFLSRDWFNNTPVAFYANGRIDVNRRTINSDPGRAGTPSNPRLYEAQFALGNTGSFLTNVVLTFLNPLTSNGRVYIFAASATAGAVPAIISQVSITPGGAAYEGSNVTFNAVITGGTAPITYQWQKGTNGIYVNVSNGGTLSGATTTNLVITGAAPTDVGDYRVVASNVTGPVNSGIATLNRVVSPLLDVTAPTDVITITGGTAGTGAEVIASAINNTIQKFLNFGAFASTPFTGPVGFSVHASMGNTIVTVLRFYTANDFEGRDPADYLLEGSLDGFTYNTISSGPLALPSGRNGTATDVINPLTHNLQEVRFANSAGYNYYRLSFNNVKDNANNNAAQLGEVEFLGVLNPNPPPNFTTPVADVSANEGTTATFTSLAVGSAPLTYQWYDVTGGDPGTLLAGQTNPNLDLLAVTAGQNGNRYRVVATNPYGSTTNPSPALPGALLTVNTGPVFFSQDLPTEHLFYAGRTETLSVQVSGSSPVYHWQRNGVNLVNGGRISGATSNVLTISNVQLGDVDTYQIITSNSISGPLASASSILFVTAAPNFHTNGLNWQLLNGGAGASSFSAENVLSLTDAGNEQRAAWFKEPMNIDGFKASFLYQDIGGGGADGFAFVLQNSAQGTNAMGGGGGGLAYLGIDRSAALMFNIYNPNTPGISFRTNGAAGTPYSPTTPVDISNGDPIQVNLSYSSSVLTVTLSNTVSSSTYTTNVPVGSLATAVGTNVAYIGITAATGGISSQQQVSNFQYIPIPALRSQSSGSSVQLTWPASIGGYGLQSNPDLTTPVWSSVGAAISLIGGQNQATVSPTAAAAFYRLVLPAGTP